MKLKMFEIRDIGTYIPVIAIKLGGENSSQLYMLGRAGYGLAPEIQNKYILLIQIDGGIGNTRSDPYDWDDRTMFTAHQYIIENFDALEDSAIVDVEYILGETKQPKIAERFETI